LTELDPTSADRKDADGLPIDRAPTLDDVRGNDGEHRRLALGCTAAVAFVLLAFWIIRALVLR
jgi:hypothetical protein